MKFNATYLVAENAAQDYFESRMELLKRHCAAEDQRATLDVFVRAEGSKLHIYPRISPMPALIYSSRTIGNSGTLTKKLPATIAVVPYDKFTGVQIEEGQIVGCYLIHPSEASTSEDFFGPLAMQRFSSPLNKERTEGKEASQNERS